MKRTYILGFLSLLATMGSAFSQANTTVNWSNFSFDSATQNAVLFRDSSGNPLSQGTGNVNTDGSLVQLGYYDAGTVANPFAGNWIPLTGFGPTLHTSVGDSGSNPTSGGSGAGIIDFVTVFNLGTSSAVVYPGDSGTYATQSSISITSTTPPNGQILSIRFYNTTNGTGLYNAVSASDWQWQTPTTTGGGAIVNLLIADAFADGAGGSLADLIWQAGGSNAFKTVIPVPEPSTFVLLGLGAIGMMGLRRRVKR
jgi:PEP-CTERM motif